MNGHGCTSGIIIRPYGPADRDAVRRLCLETAWGGDSAEGRFVDPQLVVDFLTAYYTDEEPDACWVAQERESGRVVGYLLGCVRPDRYRGYRLRTAARMGLRLAVGAARLAGRWLRAKVARWARGRAFEQTAGGDFEASARWLWWLVFRAWRELPAVPPRCAHFHFNVARAWRAAGIGQALYERFEARVRQEVERGRIVGVYGQMALGSKRRTAEVFRRLGWEIYDVRPFSKYGETSGQMMATLFKPLAATAERHGQQASRDGREAARSPANDRAACAGWGVERRAQGPSTAWPLR